MLGEYSLEIAASVKRKQGKNFLFNHDLAVYFITPLRNENGLHPKLWYYMKRILLVFSNRLVVSSELVESAGYGLDYQKIGTVFDSRQLKRSHSSKGPERFRGLCCVLSSRHRGLLPHGNADCSPSYNSDVKTAELSPLPQTSQFNSLFYMLRLCSENQLDALFILSLFRHSTSTCFGHIFSPSSGSILYTPCPKKIVPFFFSRCPVCGEWCRLH